MVVPQLRFSPQIALITVNSVKKRKRAGDEDELQTKRNR